MLLPWWCFRLDYYPFFFHTAIRSFDFWSWVHVFNDSMQFYTFLETTLVTLSLLPHFIAFFSDIDIPGSPAALATTFLTFGNCITFIHEKLFLGTFDWGLAYNILFLCSVEPGLFLECSGFYDYACFTCFC